MYHGKQLMDRSDNAATTTDSSACAFGSDREQRLSQQQKVSRCPATAFVSSLRREQGGLHGRSRMRSKSDTAWRTAARMAALAEEADNAEEREHYTRLRDAWITFANRCEFFAISDVGEE
jgi:hypothetical protein